MLSESQERMLVIAKAGYEEKVRALFAQWELHSEVIGHVIENQVLRVREGDAIVAEIPTRLLTDDVPTYTREGREPAELRDLWSFDISSRAASLPAPDRALLQLLASPDLCSREDIYRTYDTMVGTNTVAGPGGDAAVLRVRNSRDEDTGKAIALCTDGNGRLTYLDPFNGGALAVAEAARNCVCVGATPLALTNCLNFGNPEKPEIYYQLAEAINGMAAAARVLKTPVISGNVSLYNENLGRAIYPTPIVGMLGLIEGGEPVPNDYQNEGDIVLLLGDPATDHATLGGSAYLTVCCGVIAGRPPLLDLQRERALQQLMLEAAHAGLIRSAHDCSDGGLLVTLAECSLWSGLGFQGELALPQQPLAAAELLFGEAPSRIVVSVGEEKVPALSRLAASRSVPITRLGRVIDSDRFAIGPDLALPVTQLFAAWRHGLSQALGTEEMSG
jgi:phosphoribosylformylglycinamidine synthase